jgi:hypothetical protein
MPKLPPNTQTQVQQTAFNLCKHVLANIFGETTWIPKAPFVLLGQSVSTEQELKHILLLF